jgi:hypothetical protein
LRYAQIDVRLDAKPPRAEAPNYLVLGETVLARERSRQPRAAFRRRIDGAFDVDVVGQLRRDR